MDPKDIKKLRSLTNFPALVNYLRDELDWPIEVEDADEVTFEYEPAELGIDPKHAVKIESIKQVRPLVDTQPWGIFYIQFESKRLPVVVLRRILRALVPASRRRDPDQPVWRMDDLLFISAQGEATHRSISFAHFRRREGQLPELRTFSWDSRESHFYYIKNLNLEALRWPEDEAAADAWREGWRQAFTVEHRYTIRRSQELAREMARQAATVRALVKEVYTLETEEDALHQLYASFKEVLLHDLDPDAFADMVAQTVAYGLFSAATQSQDLDYERMVELIPNTNPFLKDLLAELTTQGGVDLEELGVAQLVGLLRQTDVEAIMRDFGRQTGAGREDPVIHFYELFLSEYDREQKVQRGVFYTPKPVVSFIVRSLDYLLRTELDCPDGLADTSTMEWEGKIWPKVMILDPATGTGTFLETVIEVIYSTLVMKWRRQGKNGTQIREAWNEYVPKHLLPRLYGFELMMAPYAVAHMKLGLKLKQTGYDFKSGERLRVYLTNALELPHGDDEQLMLVPRFLAYEAKAANEVKKNTPVTVVIGNPPYSNFSANLGPEARGLVTRYKEIDGHPIQERNALQLERNLNDDYVKFFACSEDLLSRTEMALLGMVTNSSFLDAQTLRGVRASLLLTFDQIRILDLGGGSDLSGSTTEEISENVFDISQGVAISLGVRTSRSDTRSLTIGYRQVTGMRVDKYKLLSTVSLDRIGLIDVTVSAPNYLFVPAEYPDEWDTYLPLNHCLTVYAEGLKTGFDNGLISFTEVEIVEKLQQLADTNVPTQVLCERYRVGNRGWAHQLLSDRTRAARLAADSHLIVRFPYRPMDFRYCPWPSRLLKASSFVAGQNLMRDRNLCLVASRQVSGPTTVTHFYVSRKVPDNRIFYSTKGSATYFPLYRHEKEMQLADQGTCLAPTVYRKYSQTLGLRWTDSGIGDLQTTIGPEAFLHFCYAVFHSPTYRSIYDSALKHEFPRVPLISDLDLFRSLCTLGADLVGLHLLEDEYLAASWNQIGKESPLRHPITAFVEKATGTTIGAFSRRTCYQDGNVYLDTSQRSRSSYFKGVPKEVWNFHIGGYQVCYKWLYDRRGTKGEPGRTLTPEDIEHYQRIVVALKETIRLMAEIDEVIEEHGGWPIE